MLKMLPHPIVTLSPRCSMLSSLRLVRYLSGYLFPPQHEDIGSQSAGCVVIRLTVLSTKQRLCIQCVKRLLGFLRDFQMPSEEGLRHGTNQKS